MIVHPLLLKLGATMPHVLASGLIWLMVIAALPPEYGLGLLAFGTAVSIALAFGRLENAAVRVLWRARPPTADEARLLAGPWQRVAEVIDVDGVRLWVGGTGRPAFVAGPHHIVLSHAVVAGIRTGGLTRLDVEAHLRHAVGRLRHGYPRYDLVIGFWSYPWDLLRGIGLGVGRRLAWTPLVGFAWRVRYIVGAIGVVLETQTGRVQSAAIIAVFIALTYLAPACARAWERHLAAGGGKPDRPVSLHDSGPRPCHVARRDPRRGRSLDSPSRLGW